MAYNSNNGSSGASNNNNEEGDGTKKKNLIIVVEEGSQDKLNELFETLQNKMPLQRPFKMRRLPESFFNPPSSGSKSPSGACHSRENSYDSGAFASGTTTVNGNATVNGLQINHSRAHSSPASLGKINLGTMGMPITMKSGGTNFQPTTKISNVNSTTVNPNPTFQSTTESSFAQPKGFLHSRGRSYDQTSLYQHQHQFIELPPGWEQAKTADGKIYYIK